MSGNWGAALGAFAPVIIGMLVMFVICCVALIFGVRIMTKDKIACTFHKNHKKGGALLKYDAANQCVWLGREDDPNREKYLVDEDCMEWIEWPGMLPHIFSATIRSLDYVRGIPTPIHPEKKASTNISAKALRLQSDGNVLQAVYMHARQSLGIGKKQALGGMVTLLLVAAVAISLFGAYQSMQVKSQTDAIKSHIQTIENALGIQSAPTTPAPTATPKTTQPTVPNITPSTGGK